jgi:hypothetical protein
MVYFFTINKSTRNLLSAGGVELPCCIAPVYR